MLDFKDKLYKDMIDNIADAIVSRNCDLIETDQDEKGHACANIDKLENIVKDEIWELDYDEQIKLILLNPIYKKNSYRDELLPLWLIEKFLSNDADQQIDARQDLKEIFINSNENILNDCIDDVKFIVREMGSDLFWETYDVVNGF